MNKKNTNISDFINQCTKRLRPKIVYHTGFLMADRLENYDVDTKARIIFKMFKENKVILYQKKIFYCKDQKENNVYEYYAEGILKI